MEANKNNKKKKSNFSIRKLIYNDKYLIIFSIVAAIAIWIGTSMSLSPETTKTITVPVNVDFSESAAAQLGIKCYGEETFDVDVTISCKKYLAKDITSDDLNVSLLTNTVASKGNIEVPVKVESGENADFKIQSYYPKVYEAYFDVEEEKAMNIEVDYENENFIADGYVMGEPLLSETTAAVKGPKTYMSRVDRLVANVSIDEKMKTTQSIDLNLRAVDANGDAVDYVSVNTGTANLTLTIPVLKEMQLNVTSSFVNNPDSIDTSAFKIEYSKAVVNAGVLEDAGIVEANIGNIDFSQLKIGENKFTFDVSTLESMVILDDVKEITVTVYVPSTLKKRDISVDRSAVTVTNIPDGYEATVTSVSQNAVTVIGANSQVNSDDIGIGLVVDLSAYKNDIKVGSNEYKITTSVENSKGCWIYGSYTATVSITKK